MTYSLDIFCTWWRLVIGASLCSWCQCCYLPLNIYSSHCLCLSTRLVELMLNSGTAPRDWLWTTIIWLRSQRWGCLVAWFCYQPIAKPGKKTAARLWPEPSSDLEEWAPPTWMATDGWTGHWFGDRLQLAGLNHFYKSTSAQGIVHSTDQVFAG